MLSRNFSQKRWFLQINWCLTLSMQRRVISTQRILTSSLVIEQWPSYQKRWTLDLLVAFHMTVAKIPFKKVRLGLCHLPLHSKNLGVSFNNPSQSPNSIFGGSEQAQKEESFFGSFWSKKSSRKAGVLEAVSFYYPASSWRHSVSLQLFWKLQEILLSAKSRKRKWSVRRMIKNWPHV